LELAIPSSWDYWYAPPCPANVSILKIRKEHNQFPSVGKDCGRK
jgi:hypothetical protein